MAAHPQAKASQRGFTLIELMIAVAIVGLLVMVALPSYQDAVRKGRRAEAFAAISSVQQAQERWRANKALYASKSELSLLPGAGLGIPATTAPGGYYSLVLSDDPGLATSYTVIATAAGGQAADSACKLLGARMINGTVTMGSSSDSIDWNNPDPKRCWAR